MQGLNVDARIYRPWQYGCRKLAAAHSQDPVGNPHETSSGPARKEGAGSVANRQCWRVAWRLLVTHVPQLPSVSREPQQTNELVVAFHAQCLGQVPVQACDAESAAEARRVKEAAANEMQRVKEVQRVKEAAGEEVQRAKEAADKAVQRATEAADKAVQRHKQAAEEAADRLSYYHMQSGMAESQRQKLEIVQSLNKICVTHIVNKQGNFRAHMSWGAGRK